jgi:hypothetical protein
MEELVMNKRNLLIGGALVALLVWAVRTVGLYDAQRNELAYDVYGRGYWR